jgi:hypothetical protein
MGRLPGLTAPGNESPHLGGQGGKAEVLVRVTAVPAGVGVEGNRLPGMSGPSQVKRRSIGIVFADGGLLALTATLPQGASGHGEEEVAAVLCDPDAAPVEFEEALLSTEYGEDGVQRRATLELWADVENGRPLRGAGSLISSVAVHRGGLDSRIAFFRWSVEGREGLGHYEVARDDG